MSMEYPDIASDKMIEEAGIEDKKELMAMCYASSEVACKVLFGRRFYRDFSPMHKELFEALDDDSLQYLLVEAFRGFGKTTILTIAFAATRALLQKSHFIVPLGCTATHSEHQSENLKNELLANKVVKNLFGPIKSSVFSKEIWRIKDGSFIMPRSYGQQLRGLLEDIYRPDLVLADDLEDERFIKNEVHRKEVEDWFWSTVLKLFEHGEGGPNWRMIVMGTKLHEDCLLVHLEEDPKWTVVNVPICDEQFRSKWWQFWPDARVWQEVEDHRKNQKMDIFYREYMNTTVCTETRQFRPEFFRYYEETEEKINEQHGNKSVVILDPAKTTKIQSAESGIVGVTMNPKLGKVYVRDTRGEKLHPDEMYMATFEMALKIKTRTIAVEVTSLEDFIMHPIKNLAARLGYVFEFIELKAVGSKEERVESLISYYRRGFMYHNKTACGRLEAQLLSFPKPRYWDLMDALAYMVKMMEKFQTYFNEFVEEDKEKVARNNEREFSEVMRDDYIDEPLPYRNPYELERFNKMVVSN